MNGMVTFAIRVLTITYIIFSCGTLSAQEWSNQLSKDIPLENITTKRSNYHSVLTQLTLDRKKWRQAYEQGSSTEKARIVKTAR